MKLSRRALGLLWFAPSICVPLIVGVLWHWNFKVDKTGGPFLTLFIGLAIYSLCVSVLQIRSDGVKAPMAWLLELGLAVLIFAANAIVVGVLLALWGLSTRPD